MTYADEMSRLLFERGVPADSPLDPATIPTREEVETDLDALESWLVDLDTATLSAIDEATGENAVQSLLQDAGIVATLGGVLAGFDAQPATISISESTRIIREVSAEAALSSEGGEV